MNRPRHLLMSALLLCGAGACAQEVTEEPEPAVSAALGEPCAAEVACTGSLLCVDGLCTERGDLPEAAPDEPDVWSYFDVASGGLGDSLEASGDVLTDAETGPGGDAQDVSVKDGLELDSGPDGDLETQGGDSGESATDIADDGESEEDVETETLLILLKDDSIEAGAGDTYFLLNDGEAWVADLSTPVDGQLKFAEVFLADVSAPKSCGRFRIAVWAPDENGVMPDMPTHVETEQHLLIGGGEGQTVPLTIAVELIAGSFRIGVILDGPCTEETYSPALMSDASGVVDASWLWIPVDGTPPWVPASVFGVDGRWGIRAILEGEKVVEP